MRAVLVSHTARHPLWEVEDMYKLVHQAAMGSEHAVSDERAARAWLLRELDEMGPGPDEPLIDPISADGSIVRVHLRPFASMGLDAEMLLAAFLRTAREFRGSAPLLESGLADAAQLAGEGLIALDAMEIELLATRMRASGFPAVRHSAVFRAEYHPAYRVVARAFLPRELLAAVLGPMTGLCDEVSNEALPAVGALTVQRAVQELHSRAGPCCGLRGSVVPCPCSPPVLHWRNAGGGRWRRRRRCEPGSSRS